MRLSAAAAPYRNSSVGSRLATATRAQTANAASPRDGRYKKRSPIIVPIKITRFEVGASVAKKNAVKKKTGLFRRKERMARTAAAPHPIKAAMAFQSSQLFNPQPKTGIWL